MGDLGGDDYHNEGGGDLGEELDFRLVDSLGRKTAAERRGDYSPVRTTPPCRWRARTAREKLPITRAGTRRRESGSVRLPILI